MLYTTSLTGADASLSKIGKILTQKAQKFLKHLSSIIGLSAFSIATIATVILWDPYLRLAPFAFFFAALPFAAGFGGFVAGLLATAGAISIVATLMILEDT